MTGPIIRRVVLSALATVAIALSALVVGAGTARASSHAVIIVDNAFQPASTTVTAGTRVTWTNNGDVAHTVTDDDGSFDSGQLDPGDTYSVTFNTPGTITYHCDNHSQMTGTIVVTAAGGLPTTGVGTMAGGGSSAAWLLGAAAVALTGAAIATRRRLAR